MKLLGVEEMLGEKGLVKLLKMTRKRRVDLTKEGVGESLNKLMIEYMMWGDELCKKIQFKSLIKKVEKLCRNNRVKAWRDARISSNKNDADSNYPTDTTHEVSFNHVSDTTHEVSFNHVSDTTHEVSSNHVSDTTRDTSDLATVYTKDKHADYSGEAEKAVEDVFDDEFEAAIAASLENN